jgi:hypothetical protein
VVHSDRPKHAYLNPSSLVDTYTQIPYISSECDTWLELWRSVFSWNQMFPQNYTYFTDTVILISTLKRLGKFLLTFKLLRGFSVQILTFKHVTFQCSTQNFSIITINDTYTCDLVLIITISDTSKNQTKRLRDDFTCRWTMNSQRNDTSRERVVVFFL